MDLIHLPLEEKASFDGEKKDKDGETTS